MSSIAGRRQRKPLQVLQVPIVEEEVVTPPPPPPPELALRTPEPVPRMEPIEATLFGDQDPLMVHSIPGMRHDPILEPLPPNGKLYNDDGTRNLGEPKDGSYDIEFFKEKLKRDLILYADLWCVELSSSLLLISIRYQFVSMVAGASGRGSRVQQFWRIQDTGGKTIESVIENLFLQRPTHVPTQAPFKNQEQATGAAAAPKPAFLDQGAANKTMERIDEQERLKNAAKLPKGAVSYSAAQVLDPDAPPPPDVTLQNIVGKEPLDHVNDPNITLLRLMMTGKASESALKAWDAM